jgi:hypothetical protein
VKGWCKSGDDDVYNPARSWTNWTRRSIDRPRLFIKKEKEIKNDNVRYDITLC